MKRNSIRRWLSLLLTAALLTALLPAAVFAASGGGCVRGLDHQWGEWITTKQPTCTEEGMRKRTCSRCGKTETGSIPAKGHRFGEWTVVSEPTDRAPGMKEHTCGICGWVAQVYTDPEGTLRIGDRGTSVKELQDALKIAGYDTGSELSLYGDKTEAAVIAFERDHGFTPDGIAWPAVIDAVKLVSADPMGTTVGAVTKDGISVQPDGSQEDADGGQEEGLDGLGGGSEYTDPHIHIMAVIENEKPLYYNGETVKILVKVKNTGNVPLNVTTQVPGLGVMCAPVESLGFVTYPTEYTLSPEDFKTDTMEIEFYAHGIYEPTGQTAEDHDSVFIPLAKDDPVPPEDPVTPEDPVPPVAPETNDPDITLTAVLDGPMTLWKKYQSVPVSLTVVNNGGLDLESVTLSQAGGPQIAVFSLAKGASEKRSAQYTVTAADAFKPSVKVTYKAVGISADGKEVSSVDTVTIPIDYPPKETVTEADVSISKSADAPMNGNYYELNEKVHYSVTVTNNGTEDVTVDQVLDKLPYSKAVALTQGAFVLPAGQSVTYTCDYTVQQADVKNGEFRNLAVAKFHDAQNQKQTAKVSLILPACVEGLVCYKTVAGEPKNGQFYTEGEVIVFSVSLVNKVQKGKVDGEKYKITHTYTDIKGYDILYEGNGHCFDSIPQLKPNEGKTFKVTHTVTPFEAWQGANMGMELVNFAWFELTDENGAPVMAWSNPVSVPVGIDSPEEKTDDDGTPAADHGYTCCSRVTETAFDGTITYTLNFCDKHAEVLEHAEELLAGDDAAAAVSVWREAADALYTDWKAAAGQEAEAVIDRDRDAFFGELDAFAALEGSAGADNVTDDMLIWLENKCVDLCHALTCGQDSPAAGLVPYDPEQEIVEDEACGAERQCDGKTVKISSLLCGPLCDTYISIMKLAAETETPGQLAGAYETGSAYCSTERNRLYATLYQKLPETVITECTAVTGWTAAEADALALLYPEHPELAAELRLRDELTHLQMLCALTDVQSEE